MENVLLDLQIQQAGRSPLDPRIADILWTMAEASGNVPAMVALLCASATSHIRERAVLRKEAPVRVAYLCHSTCTAEERNELLEKERRADVFAGLIQASRKDDTLKERLAAQLAAKPTKALAKEMLREGFEDAATLLRAVIIVQDRHDLPDTLVRSMSRAIVAACADDTLREIAVRDLEFPYILDIPIDKLDADQQLPLAQKLIDAKGIGSPSWMNSWQWRQVLANIDVRLLFLSDHPQLSAPAAALLMTLENDGRFDATFRSRLSAVLTTRRVGTDEVTRSDALAQRALHATGDELNSLIRYVIDAGTANQSLVEALLLNEAVDAHVDGPMVVQMATPRTQFAAMKKSRNPRLFKALFFVHGETFAHANWDHLDDPQAVAIELLAELADEKAHRNGRSYYGNRDEAKYLLTHFNNVDVLGATPWSLIERIHYGWQGQETIQTTGKLLQQMQLDILGGDMADIGKWHQFEALASNWDGTLLELLTAAANL